MIAFVDLAKYELDVQSVRPDGWREYENKYPSMADWPTLNDDQRLVNLLSLSKELQPEFDLKSWPKIYAFTFILDGKHYGFLTILESTINLDVVAPKKAQQLADQVKVLVKWQALKYAPEWRYTEPTAA